MRHRRRPPQYATPPYEVTAHGRNFERDRPVELLFLFDSFHEECQSIDLTAAQTKMGETAVVAFPPADGESEGHHQMMDMHLKIVVNDLAVAVFRSIERKILDSDAIVANLLDSSAGFMGGAGGGGAQGGGGGEASLASSARRSITRIISGSSTEASSATAGTSTVTGSMSPEEPAPTSSRKLSLRDMAGFVSPDSKLGKDSPPKGSGSRPPTPTPSSSDRANTGSSGGGSASSGVPPPGPSAAAASTVKFSSTAPKLITPLDASWEYSALSSRDFEAIRKRDAARREKWAADLTLLAGSPLDAYERYLKAAEMCKTGTPDPLWYASALEGCAAAHIAMAEAGGYGVDEYLENNFQMPEDIMALAKEIKGMQQAVTISSSKQTLPEVVFALCEEALNITNRHESLGPLHAELLLKLAWYVSESSEGHLRCRWGEGEGCYAGEIDDVPRWQKPTAYKLRVLDTSMRGVLANMLVVNTFHRTKQVTELLHEAVSVANIEACTRVDIATRCARLCLDGVKVGTRFLLLGTENRMMPGTLTIIFDFTVSHPL